MTVRTVLSVALVVVGGAAAPPAVVAQRVDPLGAITGTLNMLGCTPAARSLELYGVPLVPDFERRASEPLLDPPLPVVRGVVAATADPHVFSVSLPAVQIGVAYQLRIVIAPPNPCGRVFWEGPERGIAFAGVPVALVGYAPRSRIEVLAAQPAGAPRRGWVGAETIDFQNFSGATRQLRWLTEVPGVTRGLVQVATEEFPKQDDPDGSCSSAPGVVYQRTFRARSGVWNTLPALNFAAIAAGVAFSGPGPAGFHRYNLYAFGAPLYVRVVPMRGRAARCDATTYGPAPWVVLANAAKAGGTKIFFGADPPGPPPPAPITLTDQTGYAPPWFWDHPQSGETAYRVVHEHKIATDIFTSFPGGFFNDPFGYQFAKFTEFGPGETIPVGYHFWFKPGSSGFDIGDVFDGAVSIVTGVVDAVGFVVNQVSKAYESIKKAVAKVVVAAITATGLVDCEASPACKAVVETGITTGLAAAGMPPALPNWDAVVDQGFEYVAAEVVTQAGIGSVPGAQELTKAAVKQLVEEAVAQMKDARGGGGDLPKWLMLDLGEEPAILTMELTSYGQVPPLFPNDLELSSNPAFLGTGIHLPLSSAWRVTNTLDRFIRVPVVLRPNLQGFTPPKGALGTPLPDYAVAVAAKAFWKSKLATIDCVETANQFKIKTGPLLLSSTYTLTSLRYDPNVAAAFPPFLPCTP